MKKFVLLILLAAMLAACAPNVPAQPTADIAQVKTAAVETYQASQPTLEPVVPTAVPPTATTMPPANQDPTLVPTPTLPLPTLVPTRVPTSSSGGKVLEGDQAYLADQSPGFRHHQAGNRHAGLLHLSEHRHNHLDQELYIPILQRLPGLGRDFGKPAPRS